MTITRRTTGSAYVLSDVTLTTGTFQAFAGGLICVEIYHDSNTAPSSITDTAGNTYVTTGAGMINDGTQYMTLAYCLSSAAHASNQITVAAANGQIDINYGHYTTDAAGFTFEKVASAIGGFGTTSLSTSSFTTGGAGVVCGAGTYNFPETCTLSAVGSLTIRSSTAGSASEMPRAWLDEIYTAAQTGLTAGVSSTATGRLAVYVASFLESGGGSAALDDWEWYPMEPQTNPLTVSVW